MGFPLEEASGFGGVATEAQRLDRAHKAWILLDVVLPFELDDSEGGFNNFLDGVELAGSEDVIIRLALLEREPHAADIIAGMAPIAFGGGVAEQQFLFAAQFDGGGGAADFAGDEIFAAARRFVIIHDAVAGEEAVGAAVDGDHLPGEGLGATVGVDGRHGGLFVLGKTGGAAEDFAGSGVEEARGFGKVAHHFQEAEGAERGHLAGGFGDFKAEADVALAGEVVEFVGRGFGEDAAQRGGVIEIGVVEKEAASVNLGIAVKVLEAGAVEAAGAADNTVDFAAFFQQQLGEVGAVLAGDAGDEGAGHIPVQLLTLMRPSRWSCNNFMSALTMSMTRSLNLIFGSQPSFFLALV